jgi:FkbM family methyltransferase
MVFSPRNFLEQWTRSWVFRRRLPAAFGRAPLYVSPSAGLRYLAKPIRSIDESLLRNAAELVHPGDVVWDIGANIGLFSMAAAALAGPHGQVVCFEPDVWLASLLHRSRLLQGPSSASITIIAAAVAASNELRRFQIARRSRSSNALIGYGHTETGGVAEEHIVPTFNLDFLINHLPCPNVLKCDVEGAEMEVFFEQTKFFERARPIILCEVGSGASEQLTNIFHHHQYALWNGDHPMSPASEIQRATWNTIAIPSETISRYFEEKMQCANLLAHQAPTPLAR